VPEASADRFAQPASAYPGSAVVGDPELTVDLELMKHNARAMLADLQALANEVAAEAAETPIAQMPPRAPPIQARNAPP
jgi:hypothetical protein